jgi:tetratricopeptide (TPR) repeat protein
MSPEQSVNKIGKSVGEKLRAARIAQHYTQSQLAAPDFSVSYISAIERGQIHPSLRALEILAGRLGLSSTQLLPARSQQDERSGGALSITERDDDEIEYILLEAHVQIRQGIARESIVQLEKLSPKRLKRPQLLQYQYLLGWAHYKLGQYQEADYILAEALPLAQELQANYLHGHILNLQAQAQAGMRNYAQAITAHERCIELLESTEPQDPFFLAQVYMQMGLHYNQLENTEQALAMFNKALDLTEGLTTSQGIHNAYLELSKQYAEHKEYELATLYAYKSTQLHRWETSKRLKSEVYYYLGKTMHLKDATQLPAFLDEALQKEQPLRDSLTLASLNARYAEWNMKQHDLDKAIQQARQAVKQAKPYGDTLIEADALTILGHIEYERHATIEGDQHFRAGLAMLERLDAHEELARESVHYAELLEQEGKAHEAFTYFRQAFQSQQRLGK